MRRTGWWLVCLAVAMMSLVACASGSHELAGATLTDPHPVPDFTLTSAEGSVSLSDYRGQYVFLYFGYTFCPDVCPITLAKLARLRQDLGDDAGRVQVIMISVDPERDTPSDLADYVRVFDPTFVGVTGAQAEVDQAGEPYGLYYEKHEGTAATGYLVDHTARAFLIGPDGRALVAYPHEVDQDALLADMRWLIRQES